RQHLNASVHGANQYAGMNIQHFSRQNQDKAVFNIQGQGGQTVVNHGLGKDGELLVNELDGGRALELQLTGVHHAACPALATVLAVGAWADKKAELRIASTAVWMQALQQAVERYIEDYGPELNKAEPYSLVVLADHWVVDWQQPTLDELRQLGLLSPAFTHFANPPARIWVFPQEPCMREPCFLHALIVVNEPLQKDSGVADAQALDLWREATDGSGL